MKVIYRIIAVVLTLFSSTVTAGLIVLISDETRTVRVAWAVVFAFGALLALILALVLWQRASAIGKSPQTKD